MYLITANDQPSGANGMGAATISGVGYRRLEHLCGSLGNPASTERSRYCQLHNQTNILSCRSTTVTLGIGGERPYQNVYHRLHISLTFCAVVRLSMSIQQRLGFRLLSGDKPPATKRLSGT